MARFRLEKFITNPFRFRYALILLFGLNEDPVLHDAKIGETKSDSCENGGVDTPEP